MKRYTDAELDEMERHFGAQYRYEPEVPITGKQAIIELTVIAIILAIILM